jgi:anti-sigma B factor antagonist
MIYEDVQGARLVLTPEGRLDAQTAPELELKLQKIKVQSDTYQFFTKELALDFSKLTYMSSLGLRVVLQAQKMMNVSNDGCQVLVDVKQRMQEKNGRLVLQDTGAPESVKQTLSTHNL